MLPQELIERKRLGEELSPAELQRFLKGYLDGEVADYQMSAFLMAVMFRGLSFEELEALTRSSIDSGARLDFGDDARPAVGKHSTGGVGDKVSLVLVPLVAAAGLRVPKMSGRGLGHTGGTLDKLESIPGFRTDLTVVELRRVLSQVGCVITGQTAEIAPLDGRLYALRDVTATVSSLPLIASSIVSKKVAEGVQALVLDVKFGSGAFLPEEARARELGELMVRLTEAEGVRATAVLTDMDSPLGEAVGNALEVREAIACLHDEGPDDLREVSLALSAELLVSGGAAARRDEARVALERLLASGAAAERLARLIEAQGGDPRVVEEPDRLPSAPVRMSCTANEGGVVAAVDARAVGVATVELGAGRRRLGDDVDSAVGVEVRARPGQRVERGEELATIHARDEAGAERAARRLEAAFRLEAVERSEDGSGPSSDRRSRVRGRIEGVTDTVGEPRRA